MKGICVIIFRKEDCYITYCVMSSLLLPFHLFLSQCIAPFTLNCDYSEIYKIIETSLKYNHSIQKIKRFKKQRPVHIERQWPGPIVSGCHL